MAGRVIAIGDIHGCSVALNRLIESINPQAEDIVIGLGDYVDQGADTKGVIDQLIGLSSRCRLIAIMGNHDELMLQACEQGRDLEKWMEKGGGAALRSYGESTQPSDVPPAHLRFLKCCVPYFETETHLFLHANYRPERPLAEQDIATIRWLSLRDYIPGPHVSGKIAVLGHTPKPEILNLGYLICLDTGCYKGGWLSAMEVMTGRIWQASNAGELRELQADNVVPKP